MYSPRNTKCLNLSGKYIFLPAIEGISPHAINLHGGIEAWLHSLLNMAVCGCEKLNAHPTLFTLGKIPVHFE